MYFNNAGWFLTTLYPSLTWRKKVQEKRLFLTFDDGPIPGITEYVLEELQRHRARATFFCVGGNIQKHPEVFSKVVKAGHKVGNHTFNHLKGWKTEDAAYFDNVDRCEQQMMQFLRQDERMRMSAAGKKLFRPPYGLIKRSQIQQLKSVYDIVMWDVLTGDFNQALAPEKCLQKALQYTRRGSIVIFHDSIKAEKNMRYALPRFLEHFAAGGYQFDTL